MTRAGTVSALFRRALRRAPVVWLAGAVVGTLGDKGHSYFGVVRYPDPFVWGEAWWVPFLMGGAALLFVETHTLVAAAVREEVGPPDKRRLALAIFIFGIAYLASAVFRSFPVWLTAAFVGTFVLRALLRPRSVVVWVHGIGICVFGILFETALAGTGAFQHTSVDILGVPYWLGPLYLHAALCAREIDMITR